MQYFLQAGNTPSLTFFEAKSVIGDSVVALDQYVCRFDAETDEQAKGLFKVLGASVRLVKVIREMSLSEAEDIQQFLVTYFLDQKKPKLKIACAQWGDLQVTRIDFFELKKSLQEYGIKVRFLEGSRHGLSAAVLLHQDVEEVVVFQQGTQIILGKTLAIQDIDHWTLKDRGKPYADRKKGMLPPKVARAMVNLGKGSSEAFQYLYDPFCGTGTVLMEGLELGLTPAGSDVDPQAALGTQMNLAWFKDSQQLPQPFQVFQADATHVSADRFSHPIDLIVTEPFLGKPKPDEVQLDGMFRGLEKLYIGAFKQWRTLLRDKARVVIVFPRVESPKKVYDLSGLIDKLSTQGYTLLINFGDIRYHRKDAVVQRDILVFEYHK